MRKSTLFSEPNYQWRVIGGISALLFFLFISKCSFDEASSQEFVLSQFQGEYSAYEELELMLASENVVAGGKCLFVSKKRFGNWWKDYFGKWRNKRGGLFDGEDLSAMLSANNLSKDRFDRYTSMMNNLNISSIDYCNNVKTVRGNKSGILIKLKGYIKETKNCKQVLARIDNSKQWLIPLHYYKTIKPLQNEWSYIVRCPSRYKS